MKTPDTLRRMERLRSDLSRLPFVRKVMSVADYVKRVNQQLNGRVEADAYRLPATRGGDRAGAVRLRAVR